MNRAKNFSLTATLVFVTAANCFAANPYIGTWRFNEAKSKMHAGVTKNNTVTYSEEGDKIKATADGTDSDGKLTHSVWVGKFDGKAYPVKGNPYHNAERYRMINDDTVGVEGLQGGKVMWWGNHHDFEGWQNAHGDPSLDRREREDVHSEKGL
jgi:hypothetical protein